MDKTAAKELELQQRIKAHLEDGKPAITLETENEDEEAWLQEYNLLTAKPVIFAANVSEDDLADDGASNPRTGCPGTGKRAEQWCVCYLCGDRTGDRRAGR